MNSLLNKIVIGTAQFGLDYGINNKSGKVPVGEVYKILDSANENGIEFIDTAQLYGDSEIVLGSYLKNRGTSFNIISKLQDCTPDVAETRVQESLARLHKNKLYGIILHSFDTYLKNPLVYKTLISVKERGVIDNVGFSLYYPEQLLKLIDDNVEIDLVQIPYNLFDRRFENYLKILNERNIEIHVRSVFLQGLFFMLPENLPPKLKEFSEYLFLMKEISAKLKMSIYELALLFVISNTLIDKAVIGVDNLNHINDIIKTVNDNSKLEILNSHKSAFSKLEIKNETILIPSNWN